MTCKECPLTLVALEIDRYAGAAGDMVDPLGSCQIPIWLLVANRKALAAQLLRVKVIR